MTSPGPVSWLASLPVAALATILLIFLLTQAKKFLDSDDGYVKKRDFVVSRNREVLRERLQYLAADMTNEKSEYALRTIDSEAFVRTRTLQIIHCFRRMKRCRFCLTCAYVAFECVLWSAYLGFVIIGLFIIFNLFHPAFVKVDAIAGSACVGLSLIGVIIGELCLQAIRLQRVRSEGLDASIPS